MDREEQLHRKVYQHLQEKRRYYVRFAFAPGRLGNDATPGQMLGYQMQVERVPIPDPQDWYHSANYGEAQYGDWRVNKKGERLPGNRISRRKQNAHLKALEEARRRRREEEEDSSESDSEWQPE